jgi:hypothetical protein
VVLVCGEIAGRGKRLNERRRKSGSFKGSLDSELNFVQLEIALDE